MTRTGPTRSRRTPRGASPMSCRERGVDRADHPGRPPARRTHLAAQGIGRPARRHPAGAHVVAGRRAGVRRRAGRGRLAAGGARRGGHAGRLHPDSRQLRPVPLGRHPGRCRAHAAQWPRLRATLPAFDPARTPSQGVGVLPEEVRTRPGALRSDHPQSSFAALGPAAARITAGHDLNCHLGEESPLARLEELDARVLLLGVDYSACTAFHLAEYRVPGQGSRDYGCAVDDGSGRRWHRYRDVDFDTSDFPALGEAYESRAERPVTRGRIGAADSRLFDLAPAVAYAAKWLTAHRAGRRPTE